MNRTSYIRAAALADVLKNLRLEDVSKNLSLADFGVSSYLLSNPERLVPTDTFLEATSRSNYATGDTGFLFRSGFGLHLPNLGLAAQSMIFAETLRDALETLQLAVKYFQSDSGIEIQIRKGRCQVIYSNWLGENTDGNLDVQYSVGIVANLVRQTHHSFDPEMKLFYPNARRSHLTNTSTDMDVVSSNVGIVEFDERSLWDRMTLSNPERWEIMRRFVGSNSIDDTFEYSLTDTVGRLVSASMGISRVSRSGIAAMLGMNVRTFQRNLQAEQTTFRYILERTMQEIAMEDLSAGRSVTETALKLGYDHPQNFTTAFHRWFERTPSSV